MPIFDERQAILMAMEEYKEQTRMDHDLYLTSKRIRNEQYAMMLDRLREIDERDAEYEKQAWKQQAQQQVEELAKVEETLLSKEDAKKEAVKVEDKVTEEAPKKVAGTMPIEEIFKQQEEMNGTDKSPFGKKKFVSESIKKDKEKKPIRKGKYTPIERVEPIVIEFVKNAEGSVKIKEIQEYVQKEIDSKWTNFYGIMDTILKKSNRLHRENGSYWYVEPEPKVKENIAEEHGFKKK